MDVDSGHRDIQTSPRRRSKGGQGSRRRRQKSNNDINVHNQQQQHMHSLGQPDMFYGRQDYAAQMANGQQIPGQQFISDPLASMAMQYGQTLAEQGKDVVNKNIQKYVASSKLKYYFAVDTVYVGKKLSLLFFPYTHSDWSIHYNQDEPVAPRYEINTPDLYIPSMAFVTYILVAGMVLGTQGRFTPEQFEAQASSALVWLIIEMVAFSLTLYIMNLNTRLKYLDILAYCGYKFVGMTASLLAGVCMGRTIYYGVLLWFCVSLMFFLMRTLKVQVMPRQSDSRFPSGTKRSLHFILSVSLVQPLLMWWLTSRVIIFKKPLT